MMDPNADQIPLHQNQGTEKSLGGSSILTKTLHPTVKANLGGQDVRIMIETGAKLLLKLKRPEPRCNEQMYGTVTKTVESLTNIFGTGRNIAGR